MLIFSVAIMKTIDERELQKTIKGKQTKTERGKGNRTYSERVRNLQWNLQCASCSSSYIGKTCRQFKTRIEEHIKKDNKYHIFKHLRSIATCFDSDNSLCFKIIDNSKFDLNIKEAFPINWRKPNLKSTIKSFSSYRFTIGSFPLAPFCLCLFFFCCFLQFSFIYCFHYFYANYRHLLLS